MLTQNLHHFFSTHRVDLQGKRLLVAVSGGPDSVALLHALHRLNHRSDTDPSFTLHIAHMNHGLRQEHSDADAAFVKALAGELGLPFHEERIEEEAPSSSFEAWARQHRYRFLNRVADDMGAAYILTGHTADDQAETLLLNLFRGAGTRGLGAMLPLGPGRLCRPFLDTRKSEIIRALSEHKIDYRDDASNQNQDLNRNWVRQTLLPLLESRFSEGITPTLHRTASHMASLDAYLENQVEALQAEVEDGHGAISVSALRSQPEVLQRLLLRGALEKQLGTLPSWEQVENLMHLALEASPSASLDLGAGVRAQREYDLLKFAQGERPKGRPSPTQIGDATHEISPNGQQEWGYLRLTWTSEPLPTVVTGQDGRGDGKTRVSFDLRRLVPPLQLRPIDAGDRLEPFGMEGSQKISDLLVNLKVPRHLRSNVPVLCDNGGKDGKSRILWVVGHRASRHASVGPETTQVAIFRAETNL